MTRIVAASALLFVGACAGSEPSAHPTATTQPDDIVCPHCQMKTYAWDDYDRHTGLRHRQATVMECPYCVVRTTGVWTVLGESHTCKCCPAGAERCPMCRAADDANHGVGVADKTAKIDETPRTAPVSARTDH